MKQDARYPLGIVAASVAILTTACGTSEGGPTGLSLTAGRIDVSLTATGVDVPASFQVVLDTEAARSIDVNRSLTLTSVAAGEHAVRLVAIPPNCAAMGENPRMVTVSAGGSASVAFVVTCSRSAGSLAVTAATSGVQPDPDGYLVALDDGPTRTLASGDTVTFSAVATGEHFVELTEAAPNCAVRGDNPAASVVSASERTDLEFRVECRVGAGALRLSTQTVGAGVDADGFIALVDGDEPYPMDGSDVRVIGGLSGGSHKVELVDVADHCEVTSTNPASFVIEADATTDLGFQVQCAEGGGLAPTVTISSPDTTSTRVPLRVTPGTPVTFEGRAVESGRELSGTKLAWMSNLDGDLGTGASIIAGTLTEGQHTVTLTAQGAAASGSESVLVVVVSEPQPGYQIKLRLAEGLTLTPPQQEAIEGAIDRLTAIVVGDVPDVPFETSAFTCGAFIPPFDETIDDLIVYLAITAIDGPGGILGAATPCIERESGLPALGGMVFDVFDLTVLESAGFVDELLLHEAMHVMGFGSIWRRLGLLELPSNSQAGGTPGNDTYFDGERAIEQFLGLGGDTYTGGNIVPVENDTLRFGSGSLDGHWREGVLAHEIMTSALNTASPTNPLSAITIGQFADLGYEVNLAAAEPYEQEFSWTLPGARAVGRTFVLEGDVLVGPRWIVRPDGTKRRVR